MARALISLRGMSAPGGSRPRPVMVALGRVCGACITVVKSENSDEANRAVVRARRSIDLSPAFWQSMRLQATRWESQAIALEVGGPRLGLARWSEESLSDLIA